MQKITFLIFISTVLFSCNEDKIMMYKSSHELLKYSGRHEVLTDFTTALIGSAASVEFNTKGTTVTLNIQSELNPRNYVVLTINDEYKERYQLQGDTIHKIEIQLPENEINKVGVFKASEAFHGGIIIHDIEAEEIVPIDDNKTVSIEFIGDSITCGALADNSGIDCNEGEYIDQHNAYLSYAPRVARALNADYVLSSVSGIGMYRNWNDENIEEPIMPQVYDNLRLNLDASKPYKSTIQPDIISICLGTNDMSDGDGVKERLPFNSEKYTANYIKFVENVYKHYPNTQLALLNSPMVDGDRNDTLVSCLKKVQAHFKEKNIALFEFDELYVTGCNYHPSVEEHKKMADLLIPFYKNLLNE